MARTKNGSLKPFEKIITLLLSGKEVTIEEIEKTLGKEIQMYRLSTYIWHIKTRADGIVKAVKDGRKVVAYQLVNVKEIKQYMNDINAAATKTKPSKPAKPAKPTKPAKQPKKKTKKVSSLTDLNAQKVSADVATAEVEVVEIQEAA